MEDIPVSMGAQGIQRYVSPETQKTGLLREIMDGATLNQMSMETPHTELLPKISDEITLNHIIPNLSWRDFYNLSSVSHGWCHAIRSRQVYDARVRLKSTEQLVLIDQVNWIPKEDLNDAKREPFCKAVNVLTLYSMRDSSFYQLPPLPQTDVGRGSITLDGKVYVFLRKGDVYVMDLAGQRIWTQCASRGKQRQCKHSDSRGKQRKWKQYDSYRGKQIESKLCCGAALGKIYVFHDSPHDRPMVFDPARNSLSVIKPPMIMPNRHSSVTTVGEELFLLTWVDRYAIHYLQVYNPSKDEWREVDSCMDYHVSNLFMRQGNLHCFTSDGLMNSYDVMTFDIEKSSWTDLCSFPFEVLEPLLGTGEREMVPTSLAVLVVDDSELLVIVSGFDDDVKCNYNGLTRSVGFGSHHGETLWRMVDFPPSIIWPPSKGHSMSSIEL